MTEGKDWTKKELENEYIGTMTAVTIPVDIHLQGKQHVLDFVEMKRILSETELISLAECGCRKRVKRCDSPLDVCIGLDRKAEEVTKEGVGEKASVEEALQALRRSHDAGLVHIAYTFSGDEKPRYICSCCSCCCHSMSALVRFGIPEAVTASKYIATHNRDTCIDCGKCIERCQFKARAFENGKLMFNAARCFGCGLCTSTCPTKSTSLVKRE